jgi:hypothetical protein
LFVFDKNDYTAHSLNGQLAISVVSGYFGC